MTLSEASSTLLILVLQSSPQAALLDWIMQNQPEDLALMEVGEDGILQIRELPLNYSFCIGEWKGLTKVALQCPVSRWPVVPNAWMHLETPWEVGKKKKRGIE